MSLSPQTLLDQTEAAISGILQSIANTNVEQYTCPDGRMIRRAAFSSTLTSLQEVRRQLKREIASKTRTPIRLGKIGRPRITFRN